MFTFVTNASARVAAQLASPLDVCAHIRSGGADDLTIVSVSDREAALVTASFRNAGWWMDRLNPPRPPRGGTRPLVPVTPIVMRAQPALVAASDHETPFGRAFTPEMDALVRRSQRR